MKYFITISILLSIINVSTALPMGANVDDLHDWSRSLPYVNLIRQGRGWGNVGEPWIVNSSFDPITGWPTSDFGIQISSDAVDMGRTYLLTAKGNANVSIEGGSSQPIRNKTYDASTNTLTAFVIIRGGSDGIILKFHNTTGPGLQNISLLQPGYDLSSQSNFANLTLAHLSRFKVLRFMDWTDTNANFESEWNETTPLSWPLYHPSRHNPWHTISYLVNQFNTSTDIWINVPHNASDDYILNLARLMLNKLNPRSNIYSEYSNEVRNWEFPQFFANLNAANGSFHNHSDPYHFTYDNSTDVNIWANRRIAYQTKHMSDLFKTVFGQDNVGPYKRVRPILAGEGSRPHSLIDGLDYLNTVYGPPINFIHGIAFAPYFSLGPYERWTNLTVDQVLDGFNISVQTMLPEQGWSQQQVIGVHGTYAAWYKLAVHAYEGGTNTVDGFNKCSLEAKANATHDPRLTDICVAHSQWMV